MQGRLQEMVNKNSTFVKKIFYKGRMIDIVSVDYDTQGIGYHFKVTNPCNKINTLYSIPFTSIEDAEKGACMAIRDKGGSL